MSEKLNRTHVAAKIQRFEVVLMDIARSDDRIKIFDICDMCIFAARGLKGKLNGKYRFYMTKFLGKNLIKYAAEFDIDDIETREQFRSFAQREIDRFINNLSSATKRESMYA